MHRNASCLMGCLGGFSRCRTYMVHAQQHWCWRQQRRWQWWWMRWPRREGHGAVNSSWTSSTDLLMAVVPCWFLESKTRFWIQLHHLPGLRWVPLYNLEIFPLMTANEKQQQIIKYPRKAARASLNNRINIRCRKDVISGCKMFFGWHTISYIIYVSYTNSIIHGSWQIMFLFG